MQNTQIDSAVIVRSKTRLEGLTEKFNTAKQAKFYMAQSAANFEYNRAVSKGEMSKKSAIPPMQTVPQSQTFDEIEDEDLKINQTLELVQRILSKYVKTKVIERNFLPNYVFSENEMVVVVGQDGLVANTAKYVNNIPIFGVNPDKNRFDGILLPFTAQNLEQAVNKVLQNAYNFKLVTMAEAKLADGQRLLAFNDLFIGPSTHISARYKITYNSYSEKHSSSGIIVSTGAGSTGWLSSLFNMARGIFSAFSQENNQIINSQLEWDQNQLVFVVREPFQSKNSQINLSAGSINMTDELIIESQMPDNGVIFSDGIEADFLKFNSGAIATIKIAEERAKLVI